jgi:hypothetical protein
VGECGERCEGFGMRVLIHACWIGKVMELELSGCIV